MALTQLTIGDAKFRAGSWQGRADLATLVPISGAQTLDRQSLGEARNILRNQGFQAVVTAAVGPPERAAFLLDDFSEREQLHLLRYDLRPSFAGNRLDRPNLSHRANRIRQPNRPSRTDQTDRTNQTNRADQTDRFDWSDQSGGKHMRTWQRLRPWRQPRPRIRRGTSRDFHEVLTLDKQAFDEFWHFDRGGLQDSIEATPTSRLRIIRRNDLAERPEPAGHNPIIGYALAGHSGGSGYLQRLAVDPDHRQQGIATLLVNDVLRWIRRRGANIVWVNTQKSNDSALRLYKKLGFTLQDHPLTVLYRTLT